jgi:hypothetical protein
MYVAALKAFSFSFNAGGKSADTCVATPFFKIPCDGLPRFAIFHPQRRFTISENFHCHLSPQVAATTLTALVGIYFRHDATAAPSDRVAVAPQGPQDRGSSRQTGFQGKPT